MRKKNVSHSNCFCGYKCFYSNCQTWSFKVLKITQTNFAKLVVIGAVIRQWH